MAVFIATEEALSEAGIGVDGLMDAGKLEPLKNGTVLWLDSADSQPYVTTCLPACLWRHKRMDAGAVALLISFLCN